MSQRSLIGKELGNYVLRSLLGHGGMGAVYGGAHRFLGHPVAVKVLHGTFADNPYITERFFLEAKATASIDHPSIVKILDFGRSEDGDLYLVMELLTGENLSKLLSRGTLTEETVARLGAQMAEALAAAHERQVVHRDLKPDNIFVVGKRLKILDFGIAKILSSSGNTGSDAMMGTPRYMAPEQARGAKSAGPRSDVYSLGVILYKMLTSRTPFNGTATELITQALFDAPPPPSKLAPVSTEMEKLILACLEKNPDHRPQTMMEVRDRLAPLTGADANGGLAFRTTAERPIVDRDEPDEHVQELSLSDLAASVALTKVTTLSASARERSATEEVRAPSSRRRRGVLVAAGAAFGLLGAGTGVFLYFGMAGARVSSRSEPAQEQPTERAKPPRPSPTPSAPVVTLLAAPPPSEPAPASRGGASTPSANTVSLSSTPAGAAVYVDGKQVATTPAELSLTLPREVVVKLPGYQSAHKRLQHPGHLSITLHHASGVPHSIANSSDHSPHPKSVTGETLY